VDVDSPVVQEELFAPVVTVEPFTGETDAVHLANATPFGLAAGVWTRDISRAWRLAQAIQAGTVWVNGYHHSYPEVPSGGFKSSGLGRTRGVAGVEQFTELKHVHFTVKDGDGKRPTDGEWAHPYGLPETNGAAPW
jgi:acyl-CoA reductase-like NAD-dependent aldehyde dehydrogenase